MSRKCDHDEMSAQHFAFIYIDCHGNLRREVSPSLYDKRDNILSAQVTARFLKAVAERREIYSPRPARLPAAHPLPQKQLSYAVHHPGFQEPTDADGIQNASSAQQGFMQPAVLETTLQHREKVGIQDLNISPHSTLITINESSYLRRYYKKVFQNLQQTNCRVIAKVFVKTVEPRKQVQYPYNGRKTVAGITQQLSPEETRPPWWPPGVTHREPDHLPKSERIALLVHILCELRLSHGITAQKLKVAQQPSRRLIEPMDRLRLLDEMYAVRDAEEKFLEGLTDGKTTIPISKANLPDLLDTVSKQLNESNRYFSVAGRTSCKRKSPGSSMSDRNSQTSPATNMNNQPWATGPFSHQGSHFYPNTPPSSLIPLQGISCPAPTTVHVLQDLSSFGPPYSHLSLPETLGDLADLVQM